MQPAIILEIQVDAPGIEEFAINLINKFLKALESTEFYLVFFVKLINLKERNLEGIVKMVQDFFIRFF